MTGEDEVTIGGRIRRERIWNDISQRELSRRTEITHVTISRIERGEKEIELDNENDRRLLLELAKELIVDPEKELIPGSRLDKRFKEIINRFDLEELELIRRSSATQVRKNTLVAFEKIIEDYEKN